MIRKPASEYVTASECNARHSGTKWVLGVMILTVLSLASATGYALLLTHDVSIASGQAIQKVDANERETKATKETTEKLMESMRRELTSRLDDMSARLDSIREDLREMRKK